MRGDLPWWLLEDLLIVGFDEEKDDEEDEDEDEDEEDEEEDEESESKPSARERREQETAGLKSALRKERTSRKQLEKELKALKKVSETKPPVGEQKTDAEKEKEAAAEKARQDETEQSKRRTEQLVAKLADKAVETAIIKTLSGNAKLKKAGVTFQDVDDVLRLIDRGEIDVDQDDDDPTKIEIDEDSIADALKQLAKKKPHLLSKPSENEDEGGEGKKTPKFGGRGGGKNPTREQELKQKYPALARR